MIRKVAAAVLLMSWAVAGPVPGREPLTEPANSTVHLVDGVPRLMLGIGRLVPFTGIQLYPSVSLYWTASPEIWMQRIDAAADANQR